MILRLRDLLSPLAVWTIWAYIAVGTMGWGRSCRYLRRPSHRTGSSSWSRSAEGGGSKVRDNVETRAETLNSLLHRWIFNYRLMHNLQNFIMQHGVHKPRPSLFFLTHCICTHANQFFFVCTWDFLLSELTSLTELFETTGLHISW